MPGEYPIMGLRLDLARAASTLTGESVEFELDVLDSIASVNTGGWIGIETASEKLILAHGDMYINVIMSKYLALNDR